MNAPSQRPLSIDLLISDYGQYAGFTDLIFDDHNMLSFDLDGTAVTLHFINETVGILLKAILPLPSDRMTPKLLAMLHAVNFSSTSVGMGAVMLDQKFGAWLWVDRVQPHSLTPAMLHERINRAARDIAFWNTELKNMIDLDANDHGAESNPVFDINMIRL